MVVFSCSQCGDTIKKKKAPEHMSRCLRGELSCVDCGVSFPGNSYALHFTCLTEEQKYEKPGTVAESISKGDQKQFDWFRIVQTAIHSNEASPKCQELLNCLLSFPNTPRKHKKFLNFVANSLRGYRMEIVEEAWTVITRNNVGRVGDEPSKGDESINGESPADERRVTGKGETDVLEVNACDSPVQPKEKKKKRHKLKEVLQDQTVVPCCPPSLEPVVISAAVEVSDAVVLEESVVPVKRKKKHRKAMDGPDDGCQKVRGVGESLECLADIQAEASCPLANGDLPADGPAETRGSPIDEASTLQGTADKKRKRKRKRTDGGEVNGPSCPGDEGNPAVGCVDQPEQKTESHPMKAECLVEEDEGRTRKHKNKNGNEGVIGETSRKRRKKSEGGHKAKKLLASC